MPEYLEKLLYELICINSSNPDYSESAPGEEEIGNFIYDIFKKNHIDCIKQEAAPGRFNIIASVNCSQYPGTFRNTQAVLLCSHLDTVFIDGMEFKAIADNDFIYGPGSCDTKASIAANISALTEYSKFTERESSRLSTAP